MEMNRATTAFAALGHETRLEAFRLLVAAGPDGMIAGDIGTRLGVLQNTMSSHLAALSQAGLIRSQREGRAIRYFADMDGLRSLLGFLMEDCCGGRPEICQPLINQLACAC